MSTPAAISFGLQLEALAEGVRQSSALTPEGAFAQYVFHAVNEAGPTPVVQPFQFDSLRLGLAPSLAAVGYAIAVQSPSVSAEVINAWADGIQRLALKEAFPADHQTFAFRPIELLGIALGICRATSPAAVTEWIHSVVTRLENQGSNDLWSRLIDALAAHTLGVPWKWELPPLPSSMQLEEIALYRWLSSPFANAVATMCQMPDVRSLDAELLRQSIISRVVPQDSARAAILYYAIRRAVNDNIESHLEQAWQIGREVKDSVQIIESLCRRFHLFAKQLQCRHDSRSTIEMTDEYDVQDAMHALLRLHFDDVRAEEVAPSYAGNSSRLDFLLKREKVVVEVKMTRRKLGQREVVNQLIEDKERYRTHPDYRTLICFIYDPEGYCDNPAAIEDDVSEPEADLRVVVIVNPKGM